MVVLAPETWKPTVAGTMAFSSHTTKSIPIWLPTGSGVASHTVQICNCANLVGVVLDNQAMVVDPFANALGATTTNAGRALVGF